MTRRYGRAPRGERVVDYVPDGRWESITMLSALRYDGSTTCVVYSGGTDKAVMHTFAEEVLAPTLSPEDIVVMDNLSAHHDAGVIAAIEASGAQVWHLPPYSSDYNPIEEMWSKVKAYLETLAARDRQALLNAIAEAHDTVTADNAAHWYAHCGYPDLE